VTGILYDDVCDAIRLYRDNGADIGAMCDHEMVGTLGYLGYAVETYDVPWGQGLMSRYVRIFPVHPDHVCIISTRRHFTAVDYTNMVDTDTKGKLVPLHMAPRMSCVVEHALVVRRLPQPRRAYRLT
jgi:hypothetical protein